MKICRIMIFLGIFLLPICVEAHENQIKEKISEEINKIVSQNNSNGIKFNFFNTKLGFAEKEAITQELNKQVAQKENANINTDEIEQKILEKCPNITDEQLQKAKGHFVRKIMNLEGNVVPVEDIKCYNNAELTIKILGPKTRVETKIYENAIFFLYKDRQYDEGYSFYDWKVIVYDINTGVQKYMHDFDFYTLNGDETDVIILKNLLNTKEETIYRSRIAW